MNPRRNSERSTIPSSLRMQTVIESFNDRWIPFRQETINKAPVSLKVGSGRLPKFFELLKEDNSLFVYCVKEILKDPSVADKVRKLKGDPSGIILAMSPEYLTGLMEKARHLQMELTAKGPATSREESYLLEHKNREWQIASAAANALALDFDVDANYAHAVGVFRYLGENLIAWFDPVAYFRAVDYFKQGKSNFDEALTREFGFSPHLLSSRILQDWGIEFTFLETIQNTPLHLELRDLNYPFEFLRRAGEIGGVAARSAFPEYYPQIASEYRKIRLEMEETIGHRRVMRFENELAQHIPEERREALLMATRTDEQIKMQAESPGTLMMQSNRYLLSCSAELQELLRNFYLKIDSIEQAPQQLKVLLRDVIPGAGFDEGCIYILDHSSMSLIPRYSTGKRPVKAYDSARCTVDYSQQNPVTQAFFSSYPTLDYFDPENKVRPYLLGPLGKDKKAGVMYLEAGPACAEPDLITAFRALSTAAADCLNF